MCQFGSFSVRVLVQPKLESITTFLYLPAVLQLVRRTQIKTL